MQPLDVGSQPVWKRKTITIEVLTCKGKKYYRSISITHIILWKVDNNFIRHLIKWCCTLFGSFLLVCYQIDDSSVDYLYTLILLSSNWALGHFSSFEFDLIAFCPCQYDSSVVMNWSLPPKSCIHEVPLWIHITWLKCFIRYHEFRISYIYTTVVSKQNFLVLN